MRTPIERRVYTETFTLPCPAIDFSNACSTATGPSMVWAVSADFPVLNSFTKYLIQGRYMVS